MASKPDGIRQSAWDYLLQFTEEHEGLVLSMYTTFNHQDDVTVGIGTKIFINTDNKTFPSWVVNLFTDKETGSAATQEQVLQDYTKAQTIPRVGLVNRDTHLIPEYEVLQLRTTPEKARERLVLRHQQDLANMLRPQAFGGVFEDFRTFPADAQVACVSFAYGCPAWTFTNLKTAISQWDFDWACKECWSLGMAPDKNIAHSRLFWNAACVVQQGLDYDRVYSKPPRSPMMLAWQPWTETFIDLDSDAPPQTTRHDQPLNRPSRQLDKNPKETL